MRSVIAVAALISAVSAWGPPPGSTWTDGSWGTSTWGPAGGSWTTKPAAWGTGTAVGTAWASGAGATWTSTGPPIAPATGAASNQYPILGAAAAVGMAALAL